MLQIKLYHWENINLVKINGKNRIRVIVPYKNPVQEIFKPENNNLISALGSAKR